MTQRKALPLRVAVAALVVAATAIGAGTASAQSSVGSPGLGKYTQGCPTFATSEPFTLWTDTSDYFLGPAADFEGTLTGWTAKGAKIVSGNETYYVNSGSDSHSLSLPKGATATSPSICVTLDTPALRLFVKNSSSNASATLQINMTYTNNQGKASTATVAKITVAKGADWAPILPVLFLSNIQSILSNNGQTWVTFQFISNGSLLVDDFYVDPIKHH
jgi:hypothetical protein